MHIYFLFHQIGIFLDLVGRARIPGAHLGLAGIFGQSLVLFLGYISRLGYGVSCGFFFLGSSGVFVFSSNYFPLSLSDNKSCLFPLFKHYTIFPLLQDLLFFLLEFFCRIKRDAVITATIKERNGSQLKKKKKCLHTTLRTKTKAWLTVLRIPPTRLETKCSTLPRELVTKCTKLETG